MSPYDLQILMLSILPLLGAAIGYFYVTLMIRKTGLFAVHLFTAIALVLLFGVIALIYWGVQTYTVDPYLFIGGAVSVLTGVFVSEVILVIASVLRRKREKRI
ncbi:hypothetical protein [Aureibacillus halotolerans]|uniref:YesK-like protein n=1 Tax=Aureibacillus halotolerans TaxID=1508390 RepID=A0A4R6UCJ0_9BACI|nr:hypothetical protein [Aureibacillus halotolerans]TDQ40804.1 hypothetical protein EV213_105150 [Aureibacillus halotolerans]